jgi:hypothetical protein
VGRNRVVISVISQGWFCFDCRGDYNPLVSIREAERDSSPDEAQFWSYSGSGMFGWSYEL